MSTNGEARMVTHSGDERGGGDTQSTARERLMQLIYMGEWELALTFGGTVQHSRFGTGAG